MAWPDDLAAELPAPRDDEPDSLRQDIADELADHLGCALNRELHFTQDETTAKRNVLDRFGNPQRIARKLWFDWMKEKIMSQRIVLGMAVIVAVACVAACGMTWMGIQQGNEVNLALIEQSRELNRALLDRLEAIAKPTQAQPTQEDTKRSPNWYPVKVKLVLDEEDGQPAAGFLVSLQGLILGDSSQTMAGTVEETTEADGLADLGLVRPGQHSLLIQAPWKERHKRQIAIRPGREDIVKIVVPSAPPEQVDITVSVDWPGGLQNKNLWAICTFVRELREFDGAIWTVSSQTISEAATAGANVLVVNPSGKLIDFQGVIRRPSVSDDGRSITVGDALSPKPHVRWRGSKFSLINLIVAKPQPGRSDQGNLIRIAHMVDKRFRGVPFIGVPISFGGRSQLFRPFTDSLFIDTTFDKTLEFVARSGEPNHWKITLPEKLIEQVRKQLAKSEKTPKSQ